MRMRPTLSWSPTGPPLPRTTRLDEVVPIVAAGRVLVLSGAGLSTESGIPDYRGEAGKLRTHVPMTYQDFVGDPAGRQRYWARSHLGWRTIARAHPNSGHAAVTALHSRGLLTGVITQNVDGLHQAAGTPDVVELHGSLDRVICLDCGRTSPRDDLDRRLRARNPGFVADTTQINPDGDVELAEHLVTGFRLVDCVDCGTGVVKPDVVFFGENVPRPRVETCYSLVDGSDSVLVLGSSLTVMSGLRFVRRAAEAGKPVVIINHGPTRGDRYATVRVDLPLGTALTELAERVSVHCALLLKVSRLSRVGVRFWGKVWGLSNVLGALVSLSALACRSPWTSTVLCPFLASKSGDFDVSSGSAVGDGGGVAGGGFGSASFGGQGFDVVVDGTGPAVFVAEVA